MFGRALDKIAEQLITKLSTMTLGWPLLLVLAAIGASYFGVAQLRSDPTVVETLRDPRFSSALLAVATIFVGYLIFRFASPRRIVRLALLLVLASGSAAAWWYCIHTEDRTFLIDVVLDDTLALERGELATFFADVEQSHIRVTLLSRRLTLPQLPFDTLEYEAARKFATPLLRPETSATHTALITAKRLSGVGWENLFYVTSQRFSVISTYGVVVDDAPEGKEILRKYLAAMVPLAAMHGEAMSEGKKLLKDRTPATEHGCLHDFSADRLLMLEKLRRGPVMCREEEAGIERTLGSAIATEYKDILSRAAEKTVP
jgi:hypothetical protein